MDSKELSPQDKAKIQKIIDESIKLTVFDEIISLQKSHPNDAEFGKEIRKLISLIKN